MKKIFLLLTLIIILILGSIYGLLFTKFGNNIVSSYIERKVNLDQKDVKLKVNDFTLTLNYLNFDAWINDNSKINISGDLSILKKSVDLKYDIKINELSTLKNLTKLEFKGPFSTNGIFIGNEKEAIIQGISDIAQSQTKYYFNLEQFEARNINVQIKNAKIEDLLVLLNKPKYAKGDLNILADIKDANISNLDGMIVLKIINAKINNEVINKEFNQTFTSPISFHSDINALLYPNKAEIKTDLISSIADIFVNKTSIDLLSNKIESDYKIDVKNLSKLEGLFSKKLNGEFSTNGNIKSADDIVEIDGTSNIFESTTKFDTKLKDFKPSSFEFSIENAKLEKLLQMLNEPIYALGDLNIQGDIKNANLDKLDGTISSKITNASIVNEVANTVFKENLQEKVNFDLNVNTNLVPNQAVSKATLQTTLGNLTTQKSVYDFGDKSFDSDYLLNLPSLEKMKNFLKINLRGKMDINGNISNKNDIFLLNGKSNTLGGNLDFNLNNNKLNANLKNVDIQELLNMLAYPKIFDSKGTFVLDYDLLVKKGELKGNLLNGHFLPNDFSMILDKLAKFDLTKEVYETFDINSQINDKVLTSDLLMKSVNTQIDIKDSILDLEQKQIDAKINATIKDKTFVVGVNGETSHPKISFNTKDLIKEEINKQLEKKKDKIEEKLNKVLGGNSEDDKAKKLIENLKFLIK
ncbi:hypothetical protein AVENP_2383 [Arcobacter venerupis]|uniref:Uncharacterized protein n=1 Tax=Arcobacter venerupis TaxID=1054033 RepID=A0AAE7BCK1_9BACT|nr:hypothetical protein [Arcobacter venerupis]QKF67909.1 hypothetical protein AVENP_2383 [Arcobacter venerupis]RWS49512.1 hypothetical protein CKA56_09020 [Arcobacter venerupis]